MTWETITAEYPELLELDAEIVAAPELRWHHEFWTIWFKPRVGIRHRLRAIFGIDWKKHDFAYRRLYKMLGDKFESGVAA